MTCTSFQEMDESLATWRRGLQTGQGMKDSAVCHAVVAFPDVMAGDNDENSIFKSKRAKCEIGSGKFFSLSCQKSTKPFLDMCRKKLHSNATMTTDSLLSLSLSLSLPEALLPFGLFATLLFFTVSSS